ncbi:tRNA (adenine(22)-N(1))-methyltransferase [Liquorilactobacillus satsumensis]|uniref:SAM-dependent methyltransferase n=1 Tax=Liquorilactobacillus satsumensis DSM 16230 = JCM 12392 TaxID=1423801 RepID=A0A0R1V8Z6_9LACO|nr:tRNA (adenine(22)-N(1))-methyltransferase TrmK [Liquorilactobacillus satsumensis]KRL99461.1 hypothetical protein FD50_GL000159 [Liquorilactobacillus satsumensis DSM 16230 = JCM 12392]MCP9312102.1 tRNA (adenine-N(1))-methyltransferase [Liquorilactobacillus satsumensis]MCP9327811.1 tRNA (adenine-N(1))-methyltransferase [Liquorilactobacillus satsumensis]MCP9359380.1 tRNA (adenine-N(1))-methyltransferase [Liquorilactobacillus satsumensis]
MDARHLSERLLKVAAYVPQAARLADIGSDHAYLPAYLALNKRISYAVAGEIVKGPYLNTLHEIENEGLTKLVQVRHADGLAAIEDHDQIDTITICGMGGPLIKKILEDGKDKLQAHPKLILQPNVGAPQLRRWLGANGYQLIAEEILEEDQHIYEILVAQYQPEQVLLDELDYEFGPFLRREQSAPFLKKWQAEAFKIKRVLQQLKKAKEFPVEQQQRMQQKIKQIEGVLNDQSA